MSDKLPRIHLDNPYQDEEITVHFIGDVTCDKFHEIKYHKNPGYEICLINKGKGIFKIENKSYPIKRGQIFITKPPETHAGWPSKDDPYRILYLCFSINKSLKIDQNKDPDEVSNWLNYQKELHILKERVTFDKLSLDNIHFSLLSEVLNNNLFNNAVIKSLLEQYIIYTLRNYYQQKATEDIDKQKKTNNILAAKIMCFIENNIHQNINLDLISNRFNYSIPHLSRIFKDETGFLLLNIIILPVLKKQRNILLILINLLLKYLK